MIRDPELPPEEALKLSKPNIILPSREGQVIRYAWDSPVSIDHQRDKNWYIIMSILTALLVVYGIFTGSVLMAITVVTFAAVYRYVHTNEKYTGSIRVVLTERGIIYGSHFYDYAEISKFSFIYGDAFLMLELALTKKYSSNPTIYLTGAEDMEEIRRILSEKSEEVTGIHESITHRIFRILKL
ncbi:MAG: hypothetical protein ACK4NC_00870 [Candidatus Gracilibacteria bacterium]